MIGAAGDEGRARGAGSLTGSASDSRVLIGTGGKSRSVSLRTARTERNSKIDQYFALRSKKCALTIFEISDAIIRRYLISSVRLLDFFPHTATDLRVHCHEISSKC